VKAGAGLPLQRLTQRERERETETETFMPIVHNARAEWHRAESKLLMGGLALACQPGPAGEAPRSPVSG